MGFIAGILLGIAVALTREAGDRTVRDREKLEKLSGLPTLAELSGKRGGTPRFGSDGALDDAVRGLRARLLRTRCQVTVHSAVAPRQLLSSRLRPTRHIFR